MNSRPITDIGQALHVKVDAGDIKEAELEAANKGNAAHGGLQDKASTALKLDIPERKRTRVK